MHELAAQSFAFVVIGKPYVLTSRINGTDGLIQIIKQAVAALQLTTEQSRLFDVALSEDGFANLKKLRDAGIHAELSDSGTGVAVAPGARGARQEVLLSPDALKGLYDRLVFLKRVAQLETIISCQKMQKVYRYFSARFTIEGANLVQDIVYRFRLRANAAPDASEVHLAADLRAFIDALTRMDREAQLTAQPRESGYWPCI